MNNEWKFIDGYNNHYKINKDGVIVSVSKNIPLKCYVTPKGYKMASLCKNGKSYKVFLHRLLAIAFIPNTENKPYINHKDGNKLNNSLDNLEWCTKKENNAHAWRTGLCENVRKINRENGKKRDMTEIHKKAWESCIGVKRSAEIRKKISEGHKGLGAKPIKCIETKEIFSSIQEAANKYGVCHESIRAAVHNGKASCGLHFALIKVGGK